MMNSTYDHGEDNIQPEMSGEMSIDGSLLDSQSPPHYVTQRKYAPNQDSGMNIQKEMQSFHNKIFAKMDSLFTKQNEKFSKFLKDFEDIKGSIEFISKNYEDLKQKTENIDLRVMAMEGKFTETQGCQRHICQLETKIDTLEQQARICNIEICNLPEKRAENLYIVLEEIASLIKQPISKQDVVLIHRVPQASSNNNRPKNVIVKFSSRLLRDNFITAARRMKGINTNNLNMSGKSQNIYINEHLTLKNKILFRETREAARKHGYTYVWIKNGTILVRRSDTSPVFAVRATEDLSRFNK